MNLDLLQQALARVGNANLLVNLVSRRVRLLNAASGGISRPLVANAEHLGVADIALRELIEEKIGWDWPESVAAPHVAMRKQKGHSARRRPAGE
ncbi:MAG: hypothetical protein RLY20_381 [Verrucomicrobiota bacterium]|jgi:hypothetical protein